VDDPINVLVFVFERKTTKCRGCDNGAPMTRGQGLNSKFSTVVRHGGDLGPRPRRLSPLEFFFMGDVSLRTGPPPPLKWLPFPPLVAAVLITPKNAVSPGSGRIGVTGALVFFPSEAV